MSTKFLGTVMASCLFWSALAQTDSNQNYRNFPIVVTLQFHSLSMPFKNLKSNFLNIGFGLGTEVSLSRKGSLVQQLTAMWYNNKAVGNGILVYTQTAWRPTIASTLYTEVKAGAGYLYSFRPVESFKQSNGTWEPVGHKGKGMLTLPVGITLGYNPPSSATYFSPFVSYQFLIVSGYSKSIPIVPETLIQIGSRIHLN
jgi:hypothetical protein